MFWCSSWQWDRYQKKIALLATYEESMAGTAVPVTSKELSEDRLESLLHQRVRLSGTYDYDHQIIVTNREHKSGPGHWLLTPLKLDDSETRVIVSRGFIPFADRTPDTWAKYNFSPTDHFDAVVKPTTKELLLGPRNPSISAAQPFPTLYFFPDIEHLAKQLPYRVVTGVFLQRIGNPGPEEFPAQSILVEVPPQTHFGYTIEWVLLGIATLSIGFLIQAFPRRRSLSFSLTSATSAELDPQNVASRH